MTDNTKTWRDDDCPLQVEVPNRHCWKKEWNNKDTHDKAVWKELQKMSKRQQEVMNRRCSYEEQDENEMRKVDLSMDI